MQATSSKASLELGGSSAAHKQGYDIEILTDFMNEI